MKPQNDTFLQSLLFTQSIISDMESIQTLHQETLFLSGAHFHQCIRTAVITAVSITILHLILLALIRSFMSVPGKSPQDVLKAKKESMTLSYQATNLLVNLYLGCYGCLYFTTNPFSSSPHNPNSLSLLSRMISHPQNAIFGSLQVGYSLWSLPMGILIVTESYTMLIHHISTLITSILSSSFLPGFRIYAPFFFGVIELSSVPLSIMNSFKCHYEWTTKNAPITYAVVRLIFAFLFLTLRVVLWIPQIYPVLKALAFFAWTCTDPTTFYIVIVFWMTIGILTVLQLNWGWLVLKSLISVLYKMIVPTKKPTKSKKIN